MKESVTNADFGTGLLAGFAALGVTKISTVRLDIAAFKAFQLLETFPEVDLRFHVGLHPLHGDAPEARRAIGGAAARGLGYFDSDGVLRLEITENSSKLYFENLPLTGDRWRELARTALSYLRGE